MKRSIYWILIITLLGSLLPVSAFAVESSEDTAQQPSTETTPATPTSPPEDAPSEELPPADVPDASQDIEKEGVDQQNHSVVSPSSALVAPTNTPSISQKEGVVITQLQTRGTGNASDELVELYNNSDQEIDVTNWCLRRASAMGASYTKMVCVMGEQEGKESRVLLPARSYVLAVSSASPRSGFDLKFTAGMGDSGGRVGLFNQRDEKQDLVARGAASAESETMPITTLPAQGSLLQRESVSTDVYQDTDNNADDFGVAAPRSSYSYGALSDGIDFCLNIDGMQASVPEGWSRDTESGDCANTPLNMCSGLMISEVGANTSPQFIELYNSSDSSLAISGCKLQTNRSSLQFSFPDQAVEPHGVMNVPVAGTGLALTKTTSGTVYLLASDGETELHSVGYADLDEDTSWAWFGGNDWRQTFVMTPGSPNTYQQYASCENGYTRNATTGRCNKVELASVLSPCKAGQYRSEETGRCRSIASDAASVLKSCADDQFRNPATNRCKKLASADDVVDCGEGRERNPTTNRCRNKVSSDVPAAAFAVEPIKDSATAFIGWWALGGITAVALGYAGWEWRREISNVFHRATAFMRPKA